MWLWHLTLPTLHTSLPRLICSLITTSRHNSHNSNSLTDCRSIRAIVHTFQLDVQIPPYHPTSVHVPFPCHINIVKTLQSPVYLCLSSTPQGHRSQGEKWEAVWTVNVPNYMLWMCECVSVRAKGLSKSIHTVETIRCNSYAVNVWAWGPWGHGAIKIPGIYGLGSINIVETWKKSEPQVSGYLLWVWESVCVYEASQCLPEWLDCLGVNSRHCACEFNPFMHCSININITNPSTCHWESLSLAYGLSLTAGRPKIMWSYSNCALAASQFFQLKNKSINVPGINGRVSINIAEISHALSVRIWQWVSVCVYEASQCFPARLDRLGANRHCASEFNPFIHLINRSCPYRKLHIHNTCYTYHTYICMCNPRTRWFDAKNSWYHCMDHLHSKIHEGWVLAD